MWACFPWSLPSLKKISEVKTAVLAKSQSSRNISRPTKVFIADIFGTSRSSWYYQAKLPQRDEILRQQILSVLADNPAYGHKRVALALGAGTRSVRRVMRINHIKPTKRNLRLRKRRDERRPEAIYPNEIKGICPIVPNLVYVGDFTYIKHKDSYVYLATYMDLFTREVVGWSLSNKHTKELVLDALLSAFETTDYRLPKIIHTDQGSEYNCKGYTGFVKYLGIAVSMSKKASPWENGYQESFYSNFKTDLGLEFDRFETLGELIEAIHQQINYHNNQRIHTTLKMSPAQFKLKYYQSHTSECQS
ncbi:TPA: IS3 family transposase [candidate division WWE3 bacterium]|uniref:IS3 family transposase n=1 Tax=candidate division WWE3 bacterium TaxID=2053526 RepID=A0A351JTL7_UNCKA|nr:IS3 family transposase [candidate division WWE3 bacterium]